MSKIKTIINIFRRKRGENRILFKKSVQRTKTRFGK